MALALFESLSGPVRSFSSSSLCRTVRSRRAALEVAGALTPLGLMLESLVIPITRPPDDFTAHPLDSGLRRVAVGFAPGFRGAGPFQ